MHTFRGRTAPHRGVLENHLRHRVDRPEGRTRAEHRQRAVFHPRGLLGHVYWWSVSPFHAVVFGGMARNITQAAAKGMCAHANRARTGRRDAPPRSRTRP
nr:DUF2867 domain-containing protein [Streptomyces sp. FT05W]